MKRNTQLAIWAVTTIALAAITGVATYRIGANHGAVMSGSTSPPAASRAAPASGGSVAAAPVDPSNWTIPQGEQATRRHIEQGLKAGDVDPATGRRILHYHDPMVPGRKFDAPAKSPFMDMMLVPAYGGADGADPGSVTVSPRVQQNLGLRTAPVVEGALAARVSAVGSIAWNERDQAVVQARATGFVERLHVRAALDRVARGQPLVELYVPDWVSVQEEYHSLRRMSGGDRDALLDAARSRMRQAGMSDEQIAQVEAAGRVQTRFTIAAPIGGVVAELMVREGMTVMAGMTLARINGLSPVWVHAEVPESQAALLRPGAKVVARSPAVPGATFEGRVQALLPEVSRETRTLKARMELANPGGRLVPGMFVQMEFHDGRAPRMLTVPTEAVIETGKRAVVMLAEDGGRFRPVEVETGLETGGQTEIRRGLQAGQRVVLSGQFLIDSEASLKGLEARLNAEPAAGPAADPAPAPADTHRTEALVEAIRGDRATLTHPPIASLKWPDMTMDFRLPPRRERPRGLGAGERVEIEFRMQQDDVPQITSMRRVAPAAASGARP